jgi:hypothetical protein
VVLNRRIIPPNPRLWLESSIRCSPLGMRWKCSAIILRSSATGTSFRCDSTICRGHADCWHTHTRSICRTADSFKSGSGKLQLLLCVAAEKSIDFGRDEKVLTANPPHRDRCCASLPRPPHHAGHKRQGGISERLQVVRESCGIGAIPAAYSVRMRPMRYSWRRLRPNHRLNTGQAGSRVRL